MALSVTPTVVVFDMGGVLVELGPLAELFGLPELPGGGSEITQDFWSRWLASATVRDFEMGRCSVDAFGEQLVAEMGLAISGPELIERFARWPSGLFAGAAEMVESLDVTTAILSNTNGLHWETQRDHERIRSLFDRTYLSYQVGLAKPDRAIFEHVIGDLGVDPGQIVFCDDNAVNVEAARQLGIDAVLTVGVAAASAALRDRGLLG